MVIKTPATAFHPIDQFFHLALLLDPRLALTDLLNELRTHKREHLVRGLLISLQLGLGPQCSKIAKVRMHVLLLLTMRVAPQQLRILGLPVLARLRGARPLLHFIKQLIANHLLHLTRNLAAAVRLHKSRGVRR